jgi:hypothetical protein
MAMKELETELRQVMAERASELDSPPPLRRPSGRYRRGTRFWPPGRLAVVAAVAAVLGLVAGISVAQVLEPATVIPVGDRFVVASGVTDEGPWRLTVYRAQITGFTTPSGEVAAGWCLDLDSPVVDGSDLPPHGYMNICTPDQQELDPVAEPFGGAVRIPEFHGDEALVYGEVSRAVASLELRTGDGDIQEVPIVRGPEAWDLPDRYFAAFVSGTGKVDLVARDANGRVLETERI